MLALRDLGSTSLERVLKRTRRTPPGLVSRLFEALVYATATTCAVSHDEDEHDSIARFRVLQRWPSA